MEGRKRMRVWEIIWDGCSGEERLYYPVSRELVTMEAAQKVLDNFLAKAKRKGQKVKEVKILSGKEC